MFKTLYLLKCAPPLLLMQSEESEADTVGPSRLGLWKCTVQWARFEQDTKTKINTASTKRHPGRPSTPLDGGSRGWRPETFQLEVQSFNIL